MVSFVIGDNLKEVEKRTSHRNSYSRPAHTTPTKTEQQTVVAQSTARRRARMTSGSSLHRSDCAEGGWWGYCNLVDRAFRWPAGYVFIEEELNALWTGQ